MIPLGRPVVPELYGRQAICWSSGYGMEPNGLASSSPSACQPGSSVAGALITCRTDVCASTPARPSARALVLTRAAAPESASMYPTSCGVSTPLTGLAIIPARITPR